MRDFSNTSRCGPASARPRGRFWLTAALVAVLTATGLVGIAIGRDAIKLGGGVSNPDPLCPEQCNVTGTVTNFMRQIDGKKGLFKAPRAGSIVAWSISLSKPSKEDIAAFESEDRFNAKAAARIGILKARGRARYKLVKQSPRVGLTEYFGSSPIFTLGKPLKVKKGMLVALTLPSWAPAYINGRSGTINLVSRPTRKCTNETEDILAANPHQKVGSTRKYGCELEGERVLFRAYFVPRGKKR